MVDQHMSPEAYSQLLEGFFARGYETCSYAESNTHSRHLILRHDVDIALEPAVQMAKAEASKGISSHYFVLVRSPLYNLLDRGNSAMVREIVSLGHAVGLHLDASLYSDQKALQAGARWECAALEAISAQRVSIISFHRPARQLLDNPMELAGRPHTYQPRFFSEIGYVADSRGRWSYGHPYEHENTINGRALQLLTHPVWWWRTGNGPVENLDTFVKLEHHRLRRRLSEECSVYALESTIGDC